MNISGAEEKQVQAHHTIVFSREGDLVKLKNSGADMAKFVLIAGQLLGETFNKNTSILKLVYCRRAHK